MENYDSNYAIAQEISARIGTSPIPFDSVYSICLAIYQELGGTEENFDSIYSILLEILPLVEGGGSKVIDDNIISSAKTWSSEKISSELDALAGTANSEIEGKETEDFRFVSVLPESGSADEQVVIRGENTDTLYKYVEGSGWTVETPDATKLYFDVENEALYSYVTADHQFARISMVNTIVVGSNLNTNADLKALKTPGVYSVVQRLTNATKGDYVKNWTLYVESVDYEEYDKSDSVYQRLVSNYTIQKRTWSATRASNDGWSSFSTYYAGEIKDSTTSKYYTWSSNKINSGLTLLDEKISNINPIEEVSELPEASENKDKLFRLTSDKKVYVSECTSEGREGHNAMIVNDVENESTYIYQRYPEGDSENGYAWAYNFNGDNIPFSDMPVDDWNGVDTSDLIYTSTETPSIGDVLDMNGTEVTVADYSPNVGYVPETWVWKALDYHQIIMQSIIYTELKALRDNKQLVPGQQYRITDYITTTTQTNTKSGGHQFDIIVTADSENKLNENARAINHINVFAALKLHEYEIDNTVIYKRIPQYDNTNEGDVYSSDNQIAWASVNNTEGLNIVEVADWDDIYNESGNPYCLLFTLTETPSVGDRIFNIEVGNYDEIVESPHFIEHNRFGKCKLNAWELKYCLDNDTNRFSWADTTNGKGVIYYMKDEWNNQVYFDFKNIKVYSEDYGDYVYVLGNGEDGAETYDGSLNGHCNSNIYEGIYQTDDNNNKILTLDTATFLWDKVGYQNIVKTEPIITGSATLVYDNTMNVTGISGVTFNGYTESDLLNMNDAKVRISFDKSMGGSSNGTITQSGFLSKFVMSMGGVDVPMLMLTFGFMDMATQTFKTLYMVYDTSLPTPAWSVQL